MPVFFSNNYIVPHVIEKRYRFFFSMLLLSLLIEYINNQTNVQIKTNHVFKN